MTTADATGGIHPSFTWADDWQLRVSVVRLRGELDDDSDATMAEQVAQALADRPNAVVLDLTEVDFIGSAALSALVGARQRADEAGVTMGLVATRRVALLPLELTGLDRVFPVFPTVREAIAELGGQGPNALSA
jgi:anti-anti-sigma factor